MLTQRIFRKDVIQDTISGEFETILSAKISVQHFQLGLALVELFMVTFLHRYASMCFIYLNGEFIPNALYLIIFKRNISK